MIKIKTHGPRWYLPWEYTDDHGVTITAFRYPILSIAWDATFKELSIVVLGFGIEAEF